MNRTSDIHSIVTDSHLNIQQVILQLSTTYQYLRCDANGSWRVRHRTPFLEETQKRSIALTPPFAQAKHRNLPPFFKEESSLYGGIGRITVNC
ncbi:hypothetical protein [Nostoc sp. CALU 1950]|uniref:hypothetical protein n=1 Tax=Nostoc sp. CALU 1950 TaxID=3104321 RepID=UPI003EB7C991